MKPAEAAEWGRETAEEGVRRSRRGFVYFITADKNIQAVKTAAAFGVIAGGVRSLAELVALVLESQASVHVPLSWLVLPGMVAVFWVADFADENTEAWRSLVEEATGEEAADDGE